MIIFVLVLVTFVRAFPSGQVLYANGLANSVDEVYDSYFTLDDNKDQDLHHHPYSQAYLNKMLDEQQHPSIAEAPESESQRVERTAYLHIQTQEKNKRYPNYLTLCHFKICNMGRKRTTRFLHMISSLDNGT